METRSVSSFSSPNSWSEEPAAVCSMPSGGASSSQGAAEGAGGTSSAPAPATKKSSGPDCTLPVLNAAADCAMAVASRGKAGPTAACIAAAGAAVDCLIQKFTSVSYPE